ncbi:aldo/keto reductase [Vineibacter terrae]|uniref:Aldo/keto reductase n=1 Tax=Vineibacter terrae TaxID=2586908 RepID=A0A5C8PSQ8_9HYPH|nr:aldo/keto reductase [Vineibacter terrae]TXL79512.1 aldo/keto reductase [Vineibacter terrae]
MKHVPLGRSGLMVSRVCLGGNSWGAKGRRGWGKFDADEAPAYFKRALDVGITFFDTADTYNAGRSEEIMGATLLKMARRDDIVISTKVGIRMSDRPNDVGTGRKHLMSSLDAQLKRLGTDYVDVYQVHRLDPHTPIEETMWSLDQIVRSGKVRYIGGSTMPAYKFAQMLMIADWKGYARPIAMQNLYNLIQREEEREMNRLCAEQGVGLIPYSPLARGFLAGNRDRAGGGETERSKSDTIVKAGTYRDCDWTVVERLKAVAAARGIKPTQAALMWLWSKSYMAAPIIGATSLDQLDDAAKATELAPLAADEVKSLEEPYQFRVPE